MDRIVPPGFEPYFKLTQSNLALLTEFWMSPEVLMAPFSATRAFEARGASSNTGTTDAFSRLVRGVMENYSRFLVELSQAGTAAWSRQATAAA